ncbi:MAG: LrgB family protein [Thermoguttaceae bacterium]|nr:LrgB family protein [Thermoguttaceae bacterium]
MTNVWTALCDLLAANEFFPLLLTLGGYFFGARLQKRFRLAIFNPLLISISVVICGLLVFGIDYARYKRDASCLSYLLTPSTICIAIPLYRQFELVKENWRAIVSAVASGVASNLLIVWIVARCFSLDRAELASFATKSITTAVGAGLTGELGGNVAIACATIALSGVVGNAFGDRVLRALGLSDPIAEGLGIGVASHGIGTARALELGETQGAFSGLAIALTGLATVCVAPLAVNLLPL